jgi:regulator of replication initiation timing
MVLKLFSKSVEQEGTTEGPVADGNQRMEQMESHLRDLGLEVVKLRQEVNTMLARQQTFKIALGRLREYLEERGALDEAAQEMQVPFQELLHENAQEVETSRSTPAAGAARKNKSNLH